MSIEVEQLLVSLEARLNQFEKNFQKASNVSTRHFGAIERRAKLSADRLEASMARAGQGLAGSLTAGLGRLGSALAAALTVREAAQAADAWTDVGNRLKTAGLEGETLREAQRDTARMAISANAELGATADLYAKLIPLARQYGRDQSDARAATLAVSQALSMAGVDAGTASGAIRQLGQALGSGVLRGDEFNSIMEALGTSSPIIRAIAAEFGVATTQLRGLAEQGRLVADRVLGAIVKAAPDIGAEFKRAEPTVSGAFRNMMTAMTALIGEMDRSIGASQRVAGAFQTMANTINGLVLKNPVTEAEGNLAAAAKRLGELQNQLKGVAYGPRGAYRVAPLSDTVPRTRGGVGLSDRAKAEAEVERLKRQIDVGVATYVNEVAKASAEALGSRQAGSLPAEFVPPPPDLSGFMKGGKVVEPPTKPNAESVLPAVDGSGSGGSDSADEFERATQRIREHTAALGVDAEAVGKSTAEAERLRAVQELLTAAQRAEVEVTPEVRAQIEALAAAYGNAAAHVDDLEKAQRKAIEGADDFRSALGGFASGFVSDLRAGVSAADALGNALNRIVDKLLDKSIGGLFGAQGTALGGGLFGGLGKLLGFAEGGAVRGPGTSRSDSVPAMLSNGEFVVNARSASKYAPLLTAINSGRAPRFADGGLVGGSSRRGLVSSAGGNVTIAPTIAVKVEGGSRGEAADQKLGENVAKQVEASVRSLVVKELVVQRRPNGLLRI